MKNAMRRGRFLPLLFLLTLALTLAFWQGCQQQTVPPASPQIDNGAVQTLAKEDPRVRAAIDVQNRHTDKLLENADISGTGIGVGADRKPVILILTKKEHVAGLPSSLEGIPTRVENVGDVCAMGYTGQYGPPIPCGVSVGNDKECAAGTIGCVVTKNGVLYALSNNHVFARENKALIGEYIDQPGRYDVVPQCGTGRKIAQLSEFKKITMNARAGNVIDAAIAKYNVACTSAMVNNLYTPAAPVDPSLGLAVKKVGRTSGLTSGTIAGINVTITVRYSKGTARFIKQIYVSGQFIQAGDSGSTMVTQSGNNLVGLNFAGSSSASFANPIKDVLAYFGVTVAP